MSITVIGLGYVGLPIACAFARAGVTVYGIDTNPSLIGTLKERTYSYAEPDLNRVLDEVLDKTLTVSDTIIPSDTYIVTVQTPVNERHESDNTFVERALAELCPHIKGGELIILESTVPIGSNEGFYSILKSGVKSGVEFEYCYCPESILPGRIFDEIRHNTRILGGKTPEAARRAAEIYNLINDEKKECTDVCTAEFVKLTQNSHRDVELAFVNQLSIMCDREGVDPFEVIRLTNTHPRCKLLFPGSGVGGHCIAVDPYFMIERYGEDASLLLAARRANDSKPIYIAEQAIEALLKRGGGTVGVLGLAYKANCDDCRESSGISIYRYLTQRGIRALANEPNSPLSKICGIDNTDLNTAICESDVIIIAQKHNAYKDLRLDGKVVIDCVGIFKA